MPEAEQLRFVTPEYANALNDLDSLVSTLPEKFPDDVEFSSSGFRLLLFAKGMSSGSYYTVSKTLSYPYPENPDWTSVEFRLGQVNEYEEGCGYITRFNMIEGFLTSSGLYYENSNFFKDSPSKDLSESDIRKIIEELSNAQPVHPDKAENKQISKIAKVQSFVRRVLFRK